MASALYHLTYVLFKKYRRRRNNSRIKKRLQIFPVKDNSELLFQSAPYIFSLEDKFPDFRIVEEGNILKTSFSKLTFNIESAEEFDILKEIFVDEDYRFTGKKEYVVIDIGANVGFASIYFSRFNRVKKIYAFEPVLDSYEMALRNFRENDLKQISLFNYGWGYPSRIEDFFFNKEVKGNSGVRGKLSPSLSKRDLESRRVEIRQASVEMEQIIQENPDTPIMMKMDCEGAEYEIIEDLENNNLLATVNVMLLEWHDYGPAKIERILESHGFIVFSKKLTSISGMLYAVRTN